NQQPSPHRPHQQPPSVIPTYVLRYFDRSGLTANPCQILQHVTYTPSPSTPHPSPIADPGAVGVPRARPPSCPTCPPPLTHHPPPVNRRSTSPRRPCRPATPNPAFPQPPRRELHRLIDLRVARAPAQ